MISDDRRAGPTGCRPLPAQYVPTILVALVFLGVLAPGVGAQVPPPPATPGDIVREISFEQRLGANLPLETEFRNEEGEKIALGECFGDRPVVLALVYFRCPVICNETLNGMLAAFRPLKFDIGRDFEVLTVSFDPREGPELAAKKKASYVQQYDREGAAGGWRFLTGDEKAIRALTEACGFRYHYNPRTGQYAHAAGIVVVTPDGRLSRYFYGIEFSSRDLQLGLVEASNGRIGSVIDKFLLLCYQYDPTSGKYGLVIMSSLRIGALLTLLALGSFIFLTVRRERRKTARRGLAAEGGPSS